MLHSKQYQCYITLNVKFTKLSHVKITPITLETNSKWIKYGYFNLMHKRQQNVTLSHYTRSVLEKAAFNNAVLDSTYPNEGRDGQSWNVFNTSLARWGWEKSRRAKEFDETSDRSRINIWVHQSGDKIWYGGFERILDIQI